MQQQKDDKTKTHEHHAAAWCVRVPGQSAWAEGISDEDDARRECERANRICQPGHRVYREEA